MTFSPSVEQKLTVLKVAATLHNSLPSYTLYFTPREWGEVGRFLTEAAHREEVHDNDGFLSGFAIRYPPHSLVGIMYGITRRVYTVRQHYFYREALYACNVYLP